MADASTERAQIAYTDEDYVRLGLKKGEVEVWEDGLRTDGRPGDYEWWYFDSRLDDGSNLVIAIHSKDDMNTAVPQFQPFATFEFNTADGRSFSERLDITADEFIASKDRCDTHVGGCSFVGDLHEYHITFENENAKADVLLIGTLPSWRPQTGIFEYGDGGDIYAWLPSVPRGNVKADIVVDGEEFHCTGSGYHDHDWGNVSLMAIMHDWYWGRAEVGGYSVISTYITATKEYGYHKFPLFMLVGPDGKLYDDVECVGFEAVDRHIDEPTGKPYHNQVIYTYDDKKASIRFRITYNRESTIVSRRLVNQLPEEMRPLVEATGFDGAYVRFTGNVVLERYVNDKLVEAVEDKALWEMMYFGETLED